MWVYSISQSGLSFIGSLTTKIYYRTDRNENTNTQTETDTLPKNRIGSSKHGNQKIQFKIQHLFVAYLKILTSNSIVLYHWLTPRLTLTALSILPYLDRPLHYVHK